MQQVKRECRLDVVKPGLTSLVSQFWAEDFLKRQRPLSGHSEIIMNRLASIFCVAGLSLLSAFQQTHAQLQSRDFRAFNPIATPAAPALRLSSPRAVPREVVEKAVRDITNAWNSGRLEAYLDRDFANGFRLEDVFRFTLPRDAKLTVLSIRSVTVLDQQMRPDTTKPNQPASAVSVVSLVSAIVETQIEFLDGRTGFVRLPGANEFTLRVTEAF